MTNEDETSVVHNPTPSSYLSLDPYMRGRMNVGKSYARPVEIDEVMEGRAVGQVVESQVPGYAVGELVVAPIGWQECVVSDGTGVQKIDPRYGRSPTRRACSACRT